MLGRLGFDFTGGGDVRHQRQVHQQGLAGTQFHAHLSGRFQERQRFDIARSTTNFHDGHIRIARPFADLQLDLIGDMGDHLDGGAQVFAAALFIQHMLIDTAGGKAVATVQAGANKTLVVTQIQVGFGAIVGHKHLTVLVRAHGARIHINVGIHFNQGDVEAAGFQQSGQGRGGNPLPQRRHHTAGDKDETRHALTRSLVG